MKYFRRLILMVLLVLPFLLSAQSYTIKGKVCANDSTGIFNASVYNPNTFKGVYTDSTGRFAINLETGINKIAFASKGYIMQVITLNVHADTAIDVHMKADLQLKEVTITGTKKAIAARHSSDGTITLGRENMMSLPAFLGEHDPVRAIQMQPGIQSGGEGSRGVFVRGGGPDQSLMLLDGTPVYNPSHVYGFLSVFNSDAVESAQIYKDNYPARYGGRLASVIDITTSEGDTAKLHGVFSFGLLTSRLHLDGALTKNKKLTFSVSARGCYLGAFSAPISRKQFESTGHQVGSIWYYFADVNAKLAYHISPKTKLELNFFCNNDFYFFQKTTHDSSVVLEKESTSQFIHWSNYTASINLYHAFNRRWSMSQHISFSRYNITTKEKSDYSETYPSISTNEFHSNFMANIVANISEINWHGDAVYETRKQKLSLGAGVFGNFFTTGRGNFDVNNSVDGDLVYIFTGKLEKSLDAYVYVEDEYKPGPRWTLTGGLHGRSYTSQNKTFLSLLPRASIIYNPAGKFYLRTAVSGTTQNLHLLTTASSNILNDFWVPATPFAKPETSWNFSEGISQKLPLNFEWSIDGFYRLMNNLVEYKEGNSVAQTYLPWQNEVVTGGKGRSYGAEFYVGRTAGIITGSVAYTLAWSQRKFDALNDGKFFSYKYDRRHNIAIQVNAKIGKHFELGASWVYGSGNMITLPSFTYETYGTMVNYNDHVQNRNPLPGVELITVYGERNNYRLPAYHHLDVSFTYRKKAKRVEHSFNLSIYNVYNHFNQFAVYPHFTTNDNGYRTIVYKQVNLLPIVPSISYTIQF